MKQPNDEQYHAPKDMDTESGVSEGTLMATSSSVVLGRTKPPAARWQ